jgi:hypothetical protein
MLVIWRDGGAFQCAKGVGITQACAHDHYINVAVRGVLLLGDRAINKGKAKSWFAALALAMTWGKKFCLPKINIYI